MAESPSTILEASEKGSIGAGTIYNLIARLAFLLGGYPLHIGLARILGPERYGVVGVVLPITMIASILVMNGPRQAISKFTAENLGLAVAIRQAALRVQALFAVLVLVVILLGAGLLAGILHDPTLAPYIRLAAPIVPIMALFSVYIASLNGLHAFGRQATAMVVYSLSRVLLAVAGAWLWGVAGALLGLTGGPLLALGVARLVSPPGRREGYFSSRRILGFSMPMIVFSAAETLLMYLDLLFVKALVRDGAQVGYYTSAVTISQVTYYVLLPLFDTLLPVTARLLGQGRREEARRKIATGVRYGLMLLVPASLFISLTARSLVIFVYSKAFRGGGGPLTLLIWAQSCYGFFTLLTSLLTAEGKPRQAMALALGMLPISALLNLFLVPRYGLTGAACATTVAIAAGALASLLLVWRDFGPIFQWRSTVAIVGAAVLSAAMTLVWHPGPWWLVPAYLVLWGADILILVLLGEIRREDWERLWGLAGGFVRRVRLRRGVAA